MIIHRTGVYLPLIYVGTILLVIGTSLYTTLSASSPISHIIVFEILAGLGTGLLFTPPLIALQTHVSQENMTTATSTMGFMKSLSNSLSVVLGGVIFQNGMAGRGQDFMDAGLDKNFTSLLTGDQAAANVMLIGIIEDPVKQLVVKEAFAQSIRIIWIVCACMAGCAVLCTGLVRTKILSDVHVETRTGLLSGEKSEDRVE
jgi:hypothetical protein